MKPRNNSTIESGSASMFEGAGQGNDRQCKPSRHKGI